MPDVIVAGAGMAGLAAAAEARGLGAEPLVVEKLPQPGGSMRLSSGVIWRHRDFDRFREECPEGDERLQRLLFERLDDGSRLARVARRAGRGARHRQPADHRHPFRPRRTDACACRWRSGRCAHGGPTGRGARDHPADPGHGRLRGQPRPAPRARLARGRPRLPARGARQHRRRPPDRARGRRAHQRRARSGVRPSDARAAGADRRERSRAAVPAVREARDRDERRAASATRRAPGPRSTWRSGSCASRGRAPGSRSRASGSASECASGPSPRWSTPPRRRARPSGAAMTM